MSACGDVCVLGHRKRQFGKLALNVRLDDHRERMSAFVLEDPCGIYWASLRSDSTSDFIFHGTTFVLTVSQLGLGTGSIQQLKPLTNCCF